MSEVLFAYGSAQQEAVEADGAETESDPIVAEGFFEAETNEAAMSQKDEAAEQPEEQVYSIAHGDGEKHSGTLEDAMMKCPALRGKPREVAQRLLQKQVIVDRVLQRAREKKLAETTERSETSSAAQTPQRHNQEQVKNRKPEQRTKVAQDAEVPVEETAKPKEWLANTQTPAPSGVVEAASPTLLRELHEEPLRFLSREEVYTEYEPKELQEATAVSPVVVEIPGGAEARMHQPEVQPTLVLRESESRPDMEVATPSRGTINQIEEMTREQPPIVLPEAALPEDMIIVSGQLRQQVFDRIPDLLAERSIYYGQEAVEDETGAQSADGLRRLFGIVEDSDRSSPDVVSEVWTDSNVAESLPAEAMEIRRAFLAAGHAGGVLLEDLVSLDGELEGWSVSGEQTVPHAIAIDELLLGEPLPPDASAANIEEGSPAVLLDEVRPDVFTLDTPIESGVDIVAESLPEHVGVLPEMLQSIEPAQAEKVETFLAHAAWAVERLEQVAETDVDGRTSIERELGLWCEQLFDVLNIEHSEELTRHFVDCIVSPETASIPQEGALSSPDIALLNYLGTREYKGDQQASLLKSIIQAVQDWLGRSRRLGRYVLRVVRDTFIVEPVYSLASI